MKEPKEVKELKELTNFIDKEINNNLREKNAEFKIEDSNHVYIFCHVSFFNNYENNYKKVVKKIIDLSGLITKSYFGTYSIDAAFKI